MDEFAPPVWTMCVKVWQTLMKRSDFFFLLQTVETIQKSMKYAVVDVAEHVQEQLQTESRYNTKMQQMH